MHPTMGDVYQNYPAHVSPLIKVQEGWVSTTILDANNPSVSLGPIEFDHTVALVPIYPDVITDLYRDQYYIVEYRTTLQDAYPSFDQRIGSLPNYDPAFQGGLLVHLWPGTRQPILPPAITSTLVLPDNAWFNGKNEKTAIGDYGFKDDFYGYGPYLRFSVDDASMPISTPLEDYQGAMLLTGIDIDEIVYQSSSNAYTFSFANDNHFLSSSKDLSAVPPVYVQGVPITYSNGKLLSSATFTIRNDAILHLEANACEPHPVMAFGNNQDPTTAHLEVHHGGITAAGVTFTAAYRLDPNSSPQTGMWEGIHFPYLDDPCTIHSELSNCLVECATTGITSDTRQPIDITGCLITNNQKGVHTTSDAPQLTGNTIEYNTIAGLQAEWMSTPVQSNIIRNNTGMGATLYHCGNVWYDNKIDQNAIGIYGQEMLTSDFNRGIDIDQGNGIRRNEIGMTVYNSSLIFMNKWNAVYDNVYFDLKTDPLSYIYGLQNAMPNIVTDGMVQWVSPITQDYVGKTSVEESALDAYHVALGKYLEGNYASARQLTSSLLSQNPVDSVAIRAAELWYSILVKTRMGCAGTEPLRGNLNAERSLFQSAMNPNAGLGSKRARILKMLSGAYDAYEGRYNDALNKLNALLGVPIQTSERRRYLLQKIAVVYLGMHDPQLADSLLVTLSTLGQTSQEYLYAKLICDKHLDRNECLSFAKLRNDEAVVKQLQIACYPNPSRDQIQLRFVSSARQDVRIEIVNQLGVVVATAYDGPISEGMQSIPLDTRMLRPGMYFARVAMKDQVHISKFTVMR
jgi:hypothetical protein